MNLRTLEHADPRNYFASTGCELPQAGQAELGSGRSGCLEADLRTAWLSPLRHRGEL